MDIKSTLSITRPILAVAAILALTLAALALYPSPAALAQSQSPDAPASVSVTRADGSLTASWDAPSGATKYHVTYTSDHKKSWQLAALNHSGTSITISGADNSKVYYVAVRAGNDNGWGGWRDSAAATPFVTEPTPTPVPTPAPPPPPDAVASVSVTRADGALTASWDAPSGATSYHVTYSDNGKQSWQLAALNHTSTSITFNGDNTKTYVVGVRAKNDAGGSNWVNSSAAGPFTPPTPPGAPEGLTATAGDGSATMTWTNPGDASITGYQYQVQEDGGSWSEHTPIGGSGAGTTSHQVNGLANGSSYNFNLQAVNGAGASPASHTSATLPPLAPGPASVTITRNTTANTLTATWTAVTGAWRYFIRGYYGNHVLFELATTTGATSITLQNVQDHLNYAVTVRARAIEGYTRETWSDWVGTSTSPPIAPPYVSLTRDSSGLAASWPAVVGADSYNVNISGDRGHTWARQSTAQTGTTYTLPNIDADTDYMIAVQSKNPTGVSGWTRSPVRTPAPPAPDAVTLSRSGTALSVSWNAVAGATSYNVRSSTDSGATWSALTSVTTGTSTTLTIDETKDYIVGVQAVNSKGTSPWTNSEKSLAVPVPAAPANISATRAKGSVTLTWDSVTGAVTYDVACTKYGGYVWESCATGISDASRTVTITQIYDAIRGKELKKIDDTRIYLFAVRARNASGPGPWTHHEVWPAGPDRIASISATRDASGISVSFTAPNANAGYSLTTIVIHCRTSADGGTTWSQWEFCTKGVRESPGHADLTPGNTVTRPLQAIDNYDSTLTYQFRARARSNTGWADWRESAIISTIPDAPSIVNYQSDQIAWSQPSNTGSGPGPVTYSVYCRANATASWSKVINGATPAGTPSQITSLTLHNACKQTGSQIAVTISNGGIEGERAYWPKPSLAASSVTATGATLAIANHHGANWYYKADKAPDTTCQGPVSTSSETLTGLTAGTTYIYKAYSDSACSTAKEIASETFTTTLPPTLTASAATTTTATLTLANHTGNWWLKETAPSTGTCTAGEVDFSHALDTLTAGAWHTYKAYSDSTCTTANELAAEAFSTAVTVSSIDTNSNSNVHIGRNFNVLLSGAQAFTTGSNTGGYTLTSITGSFSETVGNPGDIAVKLYTASGANPGTEITTATLSGSNPAATGNYAYTCSGSGCALAANTTYFMVASTPNVPSTGNNRYYWMITTLDSETEVPDPNGWTVADDGRVSYSANLTGWTTSGGTFQIKVAAVPEPSLTASSVTTTTATVTLTGHVGDWWLKKTAPTPAGTCTAGESDFSHALSALTAATTYTYKAYSDSACSTAKEIAAATFITPPGVPTNVSVGGSSINGSHRLYPVSWNKPANTLATDSFAYQLECTNQGIKTTNIWNSCGTHNISETANTNMSQIVQHGWQGGLFYYVRVRTVKGSEYSDWVIQKTQYGS